jgi:hypothetical protein
MGTYAAGAFLSLILTMILMFQPCLFVGLLIPLQLTHSAGWGIIAYIVSSRSKDEF